MRHVNTYAVLKLLHILAVIAWLGGSLNMTLLTWRISERGTGQPSRRCSVTQHSSDRP